MALFFRDPLMRELLLDDYNRNQWVRPHQQVRRPIRVHHLDWPLGNTFDDALSDLQNVMENVNEAIGNYQNSLVKDLGVGGMRTSRTEDGNLQVAIDVAQYKPEEVNVKLCDGHLMVEGKTESSENDSYHKSEFKRWIKLPEDVRQEGIKSTLTPDHKLLIDVPVNKPIEQAKSRSIPIQVQKQPAVEGQKQSGDQKQADQQQTQAKK